MVAKIDVVAGGGAQPERVPGRIDVGRLRRLQHHARLRCSARAGREHHAAHEVGVGAARHGGPPGATNDVDAVDEVGRGPAGAAGGDGLWRLEVVPGEALVGGDGEPGVLDRALGDDPPSRGIGVGHGEAGVEPLARGAAGAAELRRDEDVEQPLGHHAVEALGSEAGLLVARGGVGANDVEQLGRWHRAAPGLTTGGRWMWVELGAVVTYMVGPRGGDGGMVRRAA